MPIPSAKSKYVPGTEQTSALFDLEKADRAKPKYQAKPGFSHALIQEISQQKNEPNWMAKKRVQALELFEKTPMPTWGPDLSALNLDRIVFYVRPDAQEARTWEDVPEDIRKTFDNLGIPEAEKELLAGVGAQYDSDMVYHNLKEEWKKQGVIFENMDVAVQKYPELVKKYFMTNCVPIADHKFAMLHAAVWSGGTFIYVPEGVSVEIPMQAYFRMNTRGAGQFEHTLIIAEKNAHVHYIEGCSAPRFTESSLHAGCVEIFVGQGARVRYSSVENWSKNTFNLNTKRAVVEKDGLIEWVSGNMGSGTTMLYPASVLRGEGARSDALSVVFAGPGQTQDVGNKVIHIAPNTSSTIVSKSISVGNGVSSYRGLVHVTPAATNVRSSVQCDALMLDDASVSNTYPTMRVDQEQAEVVHEATVGKIGEQELFYLMSRGMSEEEAKRTVVSGFVEPIVKSLPLEYAVELNKLIELEMEGAIG